MSRIGKKPISIPQGTEVTISGNLVSIKGPKGSLERTLHPKVGAKVENGQVLVNPKDSSLGAKALWGTFASHISNMIHGVNESFQKKLILEGIGFKSEVKDGKVLLALGFSHPVEVNIPEGLTVTAEKNNILVSGIDKELVGSFAAQLRSLKKPEPYKGKGMRYDGEVIRRKQGKKAA